MKLSIAITEKFQTSNQFVRGEESERVIASIVDADLRAEAMSDTLRAIADSIDPRYPRLAMAGEVAS